MRTMLKENSILICRTKSLNVDFVVDKCIGSGANCFVYDAHFCEEGIKHNYRIKELYPYDATVKRNNQFLEWENPQEQISAKDKFRSSFEKLASIQEQESVGNQTTQATAIFECNNTLYSVTNADFGTSYDKVTKNDIKSVLDTTIALSKTIAEYHKLGYLHLDIKPSNFLVKYEPTLYIKLFDVDTVIPAEKIEEAKTISYTSDYAAPEQKQCQKRKICPATDIFAIGSILFERIMERKVVHEDTSVFAEWNLDDIERLQKFNPKIKRLLTNVFQKTLAANVKNRYQTAEELICDLEEIRQLALCGKPYIISNFFPNKPNFVGRENELEIIHVELQKTKMVFIQGMGGIGKSELAQKYAERFKNEYDAVVYLRYVDSLKNLFSELHIENCQVATISESERLSALKSALSNEKVLFIIDNFDVETDDFIDNLQQLNATFIFTTRTNFSDTYGNFSSLVEIKELTREDQISLFEKNLGDNYTVTETERKEITNILDYIEGYTLFIPLIAKQIQKGLYTIGETCEKLGIEGIKKASHVNVKLFKDGTSISGNVYEILKTVLNVNALSPAEQEILRILSLIGVDYSINKKELCQWFCDYYGDNYLEAINDLVESGWVKSTDSEKETQLSLHNIVCNLCREEYSPALSNCLPLRSFIIKTAYDLHRRYAAFIDNEIGVEFGRIDACDEYVYQAISELVLQLMKKIDSSNTEEVNTYAEVIYLLSNVELETKEAFKDFLLKYVKNQEIDVLDIDYLHGAYVALYIYALHDGNGEKALIYAKEAIGLAKRMNNRTVEERVMSAVLGTWNSERNSEDFLFGLTLPLYQYMVNDMFYYEIPKFEQIAQLAKREWEEAFRNPKIKRQLQGSFEHFSKLINPAHIEETENDLFGDGFMETLTEIECEVKKEEATRSCLTDEEKTLKMLYDNAFEIEWQMDLMIEKHDGTVMNVNGISREILKQFPWWWVSKNPIWNDSVKTEVLSQIIRLDESFALDYSYVNVGRTLLNCQQAKTEAAFAYCYAILGETERCRKHIDNLMPFYKSFIMTKDPEWGSFEEYINRRLPGFATLINQYEQVLDYSVALRYLEEVVQMIEQYASIHNYSYDLVVVYKIVIDKAKKAHNEQIVNNYQHKISELTQIRFKKK